MSESIVVGTDGSDTAQRAVQEAFRLGRALDVKVHVVSAYRPLRGAKIVGAPDGAAKVWSPTPDALVNAILEQAAADARMRGVKVETHAVENDPADGLMDVAAEVGAAMIVVGNRRMNGASRVLGSVPNKVSHHAGCNVLIVSTTDR